MSLLDRYDALLLDLDGTVYRGERVIDAAPEAVAAARHADVTVRFVTNNSSRSPAQVADHLTALGVAADASTVNTSAQVAARVLADAVTGRVLVVGSAALEREVELVGLAPTRLAADDVVAVVQGLSPDTSWSDLAEACLAINAGAFWVACNVDLTLPTERGQLPGSGALVAALKAATGKEPVVAGKPAAPLMLEAARAAGADRALAVGDRIDTDIEGAVAAGLDSLLVLTGVTTPAELLAGETRPTYLAADLASITEPADRLAIGDQPDWRVEHGTVTYRGSGDPDPLALLRALCAAPTSPLTPGDDTARAALAQLGLLDGLA